MTNMIFSILGLIGGVLCAVGDILFDLKGKGNKKLGTSGNIDSTFSDRVRIYAGGNHMRDCCNCNRSPCRAEVVRTAQSLCISDNRCEPSEDAARQVL